MQTQQHRTRGRERGQGMTEYIIIVAVVAVLSLAVVTQFGNNVRELIHDAAKGLIGDESEQLEDRMKTSPERTLDDL